MNTTEVNGRVTNLILLTTAMGKDITKVVERQSVLYYLELLEGQVTGGDQT